jgi:fucose permease
VLVGITAWFPREVQTGPQETHPDGAAWRVALRMGIVGLAATFLLLYVGSEVSLGSWSYSLLTETRGIDPLPAGWMISGYWFGLTLGRLVLARVAERLGNGRLISGCLVGVVLGLLIVWFVPGPIPAAAGLFLAGFSFGPIFPTMIALMADWVPPRLLPSAIGFIASAGSIGAALFPWLAGNLAEGLGLWTLLPFVAVLTTGMLILWAVINRVPSGAAQETGLSAE